MSSFLLYRNYHDSGGSGQANLNNNQANLCVQNIKLNWLYNGSEFPDVEMINAIDSDNFRIGIKGGYSIVIVIGKSGCQSCQIRELRNLASLYDEMKREVSFYAVYYNDKHVDDKADRLEALQLRKLGYVKFPVLYTNDYTFGNYMANSHVPMIFILKDMLVVSSYMPTPESDALSRVFMKILRRKLGQS